MNRKQRGFTLIELMVALVVSSLLVGMILSIFTRMSLAYRGQQQVASVQQVLAAARATIELDAKQAGLEMSQGFSIGADTLLHSPITVVDSSTGPDRIAFFYADLSRQAAVISSANWTSAPSIVVDATTGFAQNDLVVLSTPDLTQANPLSATDANVVKFQACVVKIATVGGTAVTFTTAGAWGTSHCLPAPTPQTMMYGFVAHAYRIDTTRPLDGPLQISYSGGLGTNVVWQDLAFGFTDIQVALDLFDNNASDEDGDGDPKRDWHSDGEMQTYTVPALAFVPPIQMSISLVARTDRDVEGISTAATPTLTVSGNAAHNQIGDHASVALPAADPALTGQRIYRYTTFRVDLRNMGVGE